LAALRDPDLVLTTIAHTLGLQDTGDEPPLARLIAHLRAKRLLLVLDNFEHLLPAARPVAHLLGACPTLSVLATSRALLRISGEHEHAVAPLAAPDPQHVPEVDDLVRYPAVALFLQRARATSPEFRLEPSDAAAVATICTRLDGLPLAIELAAARIKLLPPKAMAIRLERRLPILTGGARDLPDRQRTLRDTLAWSYDLLPPPEQRLFQCLAVFRGGWTLEAAESVCGLPAGDGRSPHQVQLSAVDSVLDELQTLVDNNLVRPITAADGASRFEMLETVGEYARERMARNANQQACRRRHALLYLTLAKRLEIKLRSSERIAWRDKLVADLDNLRAALSWTIECGEIEIAQRLTAALYWSWLQLGQFREGRQWSEAALAGAGGHTAARARTLLAAGSFAWHQGDVVAARERLAESLTLSAELEDRQGQGLATQFLGLLALSQGKNAEAHARLSESAAFFQAIADEWNLANTLFMLGDAVASDNLDAARRHYEESLERFRRLGDPWGIAWPLTGLGGIAAQNGDYAKARALFMEAMALRRELDDRWGVAISLTSLGETARRAGDFAGAETLLADGLALFRELGDRERTAWALHALGRFAEDQGDAIRAGACFVESLALRREQGRHPGIAASLIGLARVAMKADAPERATRLLAAADAMRKNGEAAVAPHERVADEQLLATVLLILGETAFATAWAEGQALTVEQIVGEAPQQASGPS